ncbi:15335_t:CDS:1, partial [Racocetra fulgida]
MMDNTEILISLAQQSSTSPMSIKTYGDIYLNIQTTERAVEFFEQLGILPRIRFCSKCTSAMHKTKDNSHGDKQKWTCTLKTACGHATTLRSETWLAKSKPSLAQIAKIMFCWSHSLPQKFAVFESGISAHIM